MSLQSVSPKLGKLFWGGKTASCCWKRHVNESSEGEDGMVDFPTYMECTALYTLHVLCIIFRYGRKIVLLVSMATQAVCIFIQAFSTSWALFCSILFVAGLGQNTNYMAAFVLGTFVLLLNDSEVYRVANVFSITQKIVKCFYFVLNPKEQSYYAHGFAKFSPPWVCVFPLIWATCCCRCLLSS